MTSLYVALSIINIHKSGKILKIIIEAGNELFAEFMRYLAS
jgi:hypothetical protein